MNKRYLIMCFSVLSVVHPMTVYCESCPSNVVARVNDYKKPSFKTETDTVALNKAARFLSCLGMSIDYEQDDIELAIANWMAVPENHQLFFDIMCRKINEHGDSSFRNAIIPIFEELSCKWSDLAQNWVVSRSTPICLALCSDPEENNAADEKRQEANDLFKEAAADFVTGCAEVAVVIIAIEYPVLAFPTARDAYEHLSDAWDEMNASAEAYKEANRLEQEQENSKKEDN